MPYNDETCAVEDDVKGQGHVEKNMMRWMYDKWTNKHVLEKKTLH